jgi:hypothetical protein
VINNDIVLPTSAVGRLRWECPQLQHPELAGKITGGNAGEVLFFNLLNSSPSGGTTLSNPNNDFRVGTIDINRGRLAISANGALGNVNNLLFIDVTRSGDDQSDTGFHFLVPNLTVPNPVEFGDYSNINVNGNDNERFTGNIGGAGGSRGQDYPAGSLTPPTPIRSWTWLRLKPPSPMAMTLAPFCLAVLRIRT